MLARYSSKLARLSESSLLFKLMKYRLALTTRRLKRTTASRYKAMYIFIYSPEVDGGAIQPLFRLRQLGLVEQSAIRGVARW